MNPSALFKKSFFLIFPLTMLWTFIGAQAQCGFADTISYPIDTHIFQLAQDFGAPSPRHQGRYHTGEDWYGGRANNYGFGIPVHAAAAGRVTYSSATGWGRDGGVVIIEHTFPDGTIAYSQYGHMVDLDTAHFPAPYSCVRAGEIVGAVGDIRPAPHFHFEIRVNNPDTPGPGYTWEDPVSVGWRHPAKFVRNWQTWLQPAYLWRLDLADESGPVTPPLQWEDNSLFYIDANRLGRISPDGRSLWRINLDRPAVSITRFEGLPLLTYTDGVMQRVNLDSTLSERWETGAAINNLVTFIDDSPVYHTPDDTLVAFDANRQQIRWRIEDVQPIIRSHIAGQVMGLVTAKNELLTISLQGQLLDRARLREPASMNMDGRGTLTAYTHGGLWSILADGTWAVLMENAPPGSASSALLQALNGNSYLFDGHFLYAYGANQALIWQVEVLDVTGLADLSEYGGILLLTSNHGDIIAARASDGSLCNRTTIYGDNRAKLWRSLNDDGILRIAVADQIIGLDWETFLGGC